MRLRLDPRASALLARLPRTSVYTLAELILLTLLAAQLARIVWALVVPLGPLGDWRPATVLPAGDPIARLTSFDPFFRLQPETGAAAVTALQLTLYGVRIDEATGRGSAILAGPDSVQTSYAVGDEILSGVTLKAVQFDHVVIARGGTDEALYIDQTTAGTSVPTTDGAVSVAPTPPAAALDPRRPGAPPPSLDAFVAEAGLSPRQLPDGQSGLAVSATSPTLGAFGLAPGDVIVEVGGQPATSVDDLRRIVGAAGGGAVPVTVRRGDEVITMPVGGGR